MQALHLRRFYSRIKKSTTRISKTALLTLGFVCALVALSNITTTYAVGEEKYQNLFGVYTGPATVDKGTPGALNRTESGLYYIGTTEINAGTTQGVRQFYLGANLMFPGMTSSTPNDIVEKSIWDYVGNGNGGVGNADANETFVIRTYKIVNGQPDPSSYSYNTQIYTPIYRATAINSAPVNNITTFGNTLYKKDEYTTTAGLQDKYKIDQKVNIPISSSTPIPYGTTMGADFWYCGGRGEGVGDGDFGPNDANATRFKDSIAFFTDPELCGGTAYWKIGPSITFALPTSADAAAGTGGGIITTTQAQAGASYAQSAGTNDPNSNLPNCSFGLSEGSFMGCIAYAVYYVIYWPIAWFAGIMGKLFDFFLGYTLSDISYRAEFAVRGWQVVRDISNVFFILILVWTGLSTVFGTGTSMKRVVPQLILNAILINFSLFGTRVIIDISNVVARVFYKSVSVCEGKCQPRNAAGEIPNLKKGISGYTPLSEKIVSSFNPQKIFSTQVLDSASALPVDTNSAPQANKSQSDKNSNEYASYYIVVSLIAAFIIFGVAMMFWKTAFFFLGRVIGLYMAMIFAPFAFLSRGNMPLVSGIKELSWDSWLGDLTKYALLAPIFVFFLYIIYSFLESDFITGFTARSSVGANFFETVVYIAIPMLIVYYMIKQGVGLAESYAGKFGKMIQESAMKVAGVAGGAALGIATGGVALAGRNVLGRAGARIAESGMLQNASARGGMRGWLADRTIQAGSGMSRATYDARNTSLSTNLQRVTGVGINNSGVGRMLGTNTDRTTGGFVGAISREVATETARAQRFQLSGQQATIQDNQNRAWESAYQTARTTAQQAANAQGNVFDENAFRTGYEAQQTAANNARPETTAQINRRREQQNNARLTRGSILARVSRAATSRATVPTSTVGVAVNALGATLAGNAAVAAATIVGQGAIENAAQQQVVQARAGAARAPLNPTQVTNLQNRITQLQNELTRRIGVMNNIGLTFTPPIPYTNLTAANIIDYQTNLQTSINTLQQQIDAEQNFIDINKNSTNPAIINQVNASRSTIRNHQNDQNTHRNNIRQSGNILAEYTRIQSDIDGIRTQLVNN